MKREPSAKAAVDIFCLVEESRIDAFLCATTITTIDFTGSALKVFEPNEFLAQFNI